PWLLVAVVSPNAWSSVCPQLDPAEPLRALPQIQPRHQPAQRPAVFGGDVLTFPLVREDAVVGDELGQRRFGREACFGMTHHEPSIGFRLGPLDDSFRRYAGE